MLRSWLLLGVATGMVAGASAGSAQEDAAAILNARCAACHERTAEGGLARISEQRKTPEAWDMTLVRMMQMHGVELTAEERRSLVKHLADRQGLAPAEAAGFRYILEREPTVEAAPSDELAQMCARCHSYARVALQRRTEAEWQKLAHFHLGQYPTAEYQALGRDRDWWVIASEQLPPELARMYPLQSAEWDAWKDRPAPDMSGTWRAAGRHPERGWFTATSELTAEGGDQYRYRITARFADGSEETGEGRGILYTGHEWRSTLTFGKSTVQEVLSLSEDGTSLSGRWFLADNDALGGRLVGTRDEGSRIIAVQPPYLRAGASAELAIQGAGLDGEVALGEGITIDAVVSASPHTVVVKASAAADAAAGARAVGVGGTSAEGLLTVYGQIDRVTVEPGYNIARVGGAGGPLPPVPAQFEAIGWANGPDGQPATADDLRIGPMAAKWSVADFDETAAALADAKFAGTMQDSGIFMPADAGLNPERPFQTNNAGNLKVIATVEDGGQPVAGEGQLIVTVQRWNDPPIR
jgi:quinohemoprotein amine dehydrogenase